MEKRSKAYFERAEIGRKALETIELSKEGHKDLQEKYKVWLLTLSENQIESLGGEGQLYEHYFHKVYLPFD